MTNARTMGNVRTNTVRTSYNYRKKLNTGSGRTARTVKMKDGRTASAGRTKRAVSAYSVRNEGSRAQYSARTKSQSTADLLRNEGSGNQHTARTKSRGSANIVKNEERRDLYAVRAKRAYDDPAERVYASGGRKKSTRSGRSMSSQAVRKSSGAGRTGTMRAERKNGAGAAAITIGRTAAFPADSKKVSVRTKRNRTKALEVDLTYVMFLAVMCLLTVFVCVRYLQLKEIITTQTRTNTKLTAELDTLKNENDALLENVTNEIDLDHIRDVAINELGMKYATEDQIVWYTTEDREYVHQFEDVPSE